MRVFVPDDVFLDIMVEFPRHQSPREGRRTGSTGDMAVDLSLITKEGASDVEGANYRGS